MSDEENQPCAVCGDDTFVMHVDGPCNAWVDVAGEDGSTQRVWLCSIECAYAAGLAEAARKGSSRS